MGTSKLCAAFCATAAGVYVVARSSAWEPRDAPMAAGTVEDLGTGEYRAAFCATAAGVYVVAAQLGGRNIAGSPFAAAVAPAGVCAATSAVALAPAALVAGQQARIYS